MIFYNNISQPILTLGTLDKVYQNLAAYLDAKIGLKENNCDKCRHPGHYHMAPLCAATPVENHCSTTTREEERNASFF